MQIRDHKQRQQALDVSQSFIVQAPAGSGKTELLTQRFLALLATVNYPEEIIAITFTKKAANEMRNRILLALEMAAYQPQPEETHKLTTWTLAKRGLQHAEQLQWHLLSNPNRLKVQTIDSLCASLVKQMPIMAQLGAQVAIADNADYLYQQAADNLLASIESDQPWVSALETLLLHLDNNTNIIQALFIRMLAKREQWLSIVLQGKQQDNLRELLENSLTHIIENALQAVCNALPSSIESELLMLLNFSQQQLKGQQFDCIDDNLALWQAIAKLLLRNDGQWRKIVDKRQGFPSDKAFKSLKQQITGLLQELVQYEQFRVALATIPVLPDATYSEQQWKLLDCLLTLLPILAAQLEIVFRQQQKIDYTALTQAALHALGDEYNPTDLGLRLDYKIQHLLIDEFQDTSASQYRLLERLTAGWQPTDGRSLFLVGDPMQSIYRFRAAEVGLFLRAQQYGIGELNLTPLRLSTNFRSTENIVNWINHTFADIFPTQMDIAIGAVPLSEANAIHPTEKISTISGYQHNLLDETASESDTIIDIINNSDAQASIAILVRSRTQFAKIIPALQKQQIDFQAVEIENLSTQSYIQDLLALTRALLHPADRTAWLSILRAPWCALALNDLHIVAKQTEYKTLWQNINDEAVVKQLSTIGQKQLNAFVAIMQTIFTEQQRMSVTNWIYAAWLQLNGNQLLPYPSDQDNVTNYLLLLERLDANNQLTIANLYTEIEKLYAKPRSTDARVQLMTIHKAKGLEFDIVILPSLEKRTQNDSDDLLIWQERPQVDDSIDLLLAPIKSRASKYDKTYQYIRNQEKQKQHYEHMRLLYVAATRAKQQLHLLTTNDYEDIFEFEPKNDSFLTLLWPSNQSLFYESKTKITGTISQTQYSLKRLVHNNSLTARNNSYNKHNQPIITQQNEAYIGTIAHEILYKMSFMSPSKWEQIIQQKVFWMLRLKQLGMHQPEDGWIDLELMINHCITDKKAHWILNQDNSKSEYPLTMMQNNSPKHFVIDRTFVENDTRWIIDYKTGPFTQQHITEYRKQLENYAKIFSKLESIPIKLGVFQPLTGQWQEWQYQHEELTTCP